MFQLVGQDNILQTFQGLIEKGNLGSAYLFSGPPGSGKSSMVLNIVAAGLCNNPENGNACGSCPSCEKMKDLQHPNFHMVYPLKSKGKSGKKNNDPFAELKEAEFQIIKTAIQDFSHNPYLGINIPEAKTIPISFARHLIRNLSLRPAEDAPQFVFIYLTEKANNEFLNALLKSIEEPPANTTFFLTANSYLGVPVTIRSRCQHIRFNPLPGKLIRRFCLNKGLDPSRSDSISALSFGNVRKMQTLLENKHSDRNKNLLDFWRIIMGSKIDTPSAKTKTKHGGLPPQSQHPVSMQDVTNLKNQLSKLNKDNPPAFNSRLDDIIFWLRDAQLTEKGCPDRISFRHLKKEIDNFVKYYPGLPYYEMIMRLEQIRLDVKGNIHLPATIGSLLIDFKINLLEHRKR